MSGPLAGPSGVLAAGPTTQATVDALKETLAALRAARTPKPAPGEAPAGPSLGNLVPARPNATATSDFVRELGRRAMGPLRPPVQPADTIPPEIMPLLFERNTFAPGRAAPVSEETQPPRLPAGAPMSAPMAPPTGAPSAPLPRPAPPVASPPPPAAAPGAGPMDLTRFRADQPRAAAPQPAGTASLPSGPDAPAGPVDVDLDRLARAPSNFMPLEVLQEMKARHKGSAPIRPEPVNAAPAGAARGR